MAHEVFISHSSQDKPVADAVCAALENAAIRCWIAPRDVQPTRSFAGEIRRAILRSKVMVLIFSAHSNASQEILLEVGLASDSHMRIVQFRIADVTTNEDLRYYLSTPYWLDAVTPPLEPHLDTLTKRVKELLAEPSPTPADGRQRAMNECVFVCYAREDEKFTLGLAENLKKHGIPVWLDQWNISASSDWDRAIDEALLDCSHLLIVLSPASVESPEVRGELQMALEQKKSIIPVLYQHCQIPRRLRVVQFVDFSSRQPDDLPALERTLAAFRSGGARL
jgi:hypothetical protein